VGIEIKRGKSLPHKLQTSAILMMVIGDSLNSPPLGKSFPRRFLLRFPKASRIGALMSPSQKHFNPDGKDFS
jgi:regulator of sirC expression with transglutaminase-like and TPR domain